ncbi:MAG: hypothetical protein RIR88_602 [Actinomycetota bacterium]
MEIRIGMVNTPRELNLETSSTAADIEALVAAALAGSTPFLKLSDDKGKVYIVPSATIAFVEVGNDQSRRVGFVG